MHVTTRLKKPLQRPPHLQFAYAEIDFSAGHDKSEAW